MLVKEDFKKFIQENFDTVKEANIPLSFYQDEMVKFNIVMYTMFANIYGGQGDKIAPCFAEVVHSFMRVIQGSPSTQGDEYEKFLDSFCGRYEEINKSIEEDEELKKAKPESRDQIILTQFIRMIGSASELQGEEHLRLTDMFILTMMIAELLKLDLEYIKFLLKKSVDELGKLAKETGEAQDKEEEPEQEIIEE